MADNYIQDLLGENERILLVTRQHWFVLFSSILLEILLSVLIIVGLTLAQILLPGVPVIPAWLYPCAGADRRDDSRYPDMVEPPVHCYEPASGTSHWRAEQRSSGHLTGKSNRR